DAQIGFWSPAADTFEGAENPMSPIYGGRMLAASRIYVWAWDARPFPAFPLLEELWKDGQNWQLGHWLNGRLSGATAADLIDAILADHGLPEVDTAGVGGSLAGYIVEAPATARAALEPV